MIIRALALSTAAVLATATLTSAAPAIPSRLAPETPPAGYQSPDRVPDGVVVTDGSVEQLLRRGNEVFVRGTFGKVGHYTGPAVSLDPATGASAPSFPELDGTVSTALADGDGGWFIGGDFARVGPTDIDLFAHVGADGTVDPDFDLHLRGDMVNSLALVGDTLYLGGDLASVSGQPRRGIAAVSATDGALKPFRAPIEAYNAVTEIAARPATGGAGPRLFLGTYNGVRAVNATTGHDIETFSAAADDDARGLALVDDALYVSGFEGVRKLDPVTGAVDPAFNLTVSGPDGAGTVETIQELGGRLYVGGLFTRVNGKPGSLRVVDPATGSVDPTFKPVIAAASEEDLPAVYDLALTPAGLWVGGDFGRLGGQASPKLGLVDPVTGARIPTTAPHFDLEVDAVELSGGRLFTGGRFYMPDFTEAPGLAVLDASTLQLKRTVETPAIDYTSLGERDLVSTNGRLYIGETHFRGYDPRPRAEASRRFYRPTDRRILAVDPVSGKALPGLTIKAHNLTGLASNGDELYVVRRLQDDVRFPRNKVTVHDARTGRVKRSFTLPLPGYVTDIEVRPSGTVYVAGSFRRFRKNGQAAHLAVIHVRRNGTLDSSFDPHVDAGVYDLAYLDRTLYATGPFRHYQRHTSLSGIASFDAISGTVNRRFQPRNNAYRYERDQVRITPFAGQALINGTYRSRVVSTRDGRRLFDSVDGYADVVSAALAAGGGVVYAGELPIVAGGYYSSGVSFVARSDGGR